MPQKRSRLGIIISILEAILNEEMATSRIGEYANMPYDRLKPILDELEEKNFVTFKVVGKAKIYRITSDGINALNRLREAYRILKNLGLE